MHISDFDYDLPEVLIAQSPSEARDASRLMVMNRGDGSIRHGIFRDIYDELQAGDVLIMNNTRVIPARLKAQKAQTGGAMEVLLLRQIDAPTWRALLGGRKPDVGTQLVFAGSNITAEIVEALEASERVVRFSAPIDVLLETVGEMPLPPYITAYDGDMERYQTVYNRHEGSVAAPTAGLHFTGDLLLALRDKGVLMAYCTLHIGLDTFQPVKVEDITDHKIHREYATLDAQNAKIINEAKLAGGRIIAVGTTSARTVETAAILSAGGDPGNPKASENQCPWRPVIAFEAETNLFIYPGYRWRALDGLITNFHLPKSTLLMMVSAFAGREAILNAYACAKTEGYRFYSFGDAMFIR